MPVSAVAVAALCGVLAIVGAYVAARATNWLRPWLTVLTAQWLTSARTQGLHPRAARVEGLPDLAALGADRADAGRRPATKACGCP
jgi:hypothetical protein